MLARESAREYVVKAKGLAWAVEYHGINAREKICCRMLNGLPFSMHFIREVFALKYEFLLLN